MLHASGEGMALGMQQRSYWLTDTASERKSFARFVGLRLISGMVACM